MRTGAAGVSNCSSPSAESETLPPSKSLGWWKLTLGGNVEPYLQVRWFPQIPIDNCPDLSSPWIDPVIGMSGESGRQTNPLETLSFETRKQQANTTTPMSPTHAKEALDLWVRHDRRLRDIDDLRRGLACVRMEVEVWTVGEHEERTDARQLTRGCTQLPSHAQYLRPQDGVRLLPAVLPRVLEEAECAALDDRLPVVVSTVISLWLTLTKHG
jgi:hypothetical protein